MSPINDPNNALDAERLRASELESRQGHLHSGNKPGHAVSEPDHEVTLPDPRSVQFGTPHDHSSLPLYPSCHA